MFRIYIDLCITTIYAQVTKIAYKCTDAEYLSCDNELKICLGNRLVRESQELQCENCYRGAFACYTDCDKRFASTFSKACYETCQPKFVDACAPQEFQFAPDSGSTTLTLSSSLYIIISISSLFIILRPH